MMSPAVAWRHSSVMPRCCLIRCTSRRISGSLSRRHEDALLFALRRGWGAEHALAGGHVLGHAGLGADDGPVADVDVIDDADLAGDHDVIARAARAGDAHLADEQVVPADPAVVADLHEVVDLGAFADRVAWNVPRSIVVQAPISTSSPISTWPSCGTLTCRPFCSR